MVFLFFFTIVNKMARHYGIGHVAVTWKDYTIIWGGTHFHPSFVYYHLHGEWVWQKTYGDLPKERIFATAVVIKDKMVVVGGRRTNTNDVYILDLNAWTWSKVTPEGIPPLKGTSGGGSSWVYENKMYCFGGKIDAPGPYLVYTNQLFCYNISTNCWEWPNVEGEIPHPRAYHASIINGDTVFLFGGATQPRTESVKTPLNDLYMLDMVSLRWKRVHGPRPNNSTFNVPNAREWHSLTWISPSKAILFGGFHRQRHRNPDYRDCWILDLNKAKENLDISSIWKQIPVNDYEKRRYHKALVEPVSQRLWLIDGNYSSKKVETISMNVVPLKVQAMECVVGKIRMDDPALKTAPKMLKKDIDTYRSSFDPISTGPSLPETSVEESNESDDGDGGLENNTADAVLDFAASLLFYLMSHVLEFRSNPFVTSIERK